MLLVIFSIISRIKICMKIIKVLGSTVLMVLGVAMFVYGGWDDSPGGQGLGVLMVVGGVFGLVKTLKKNS